jgi:alpha-glucosidase (family GH31 glycosyl hydrolase)
MPFFRAHNNIPPEESAKVNNFAAREPWYQSERVQNVIRQAIYQRYAFMHYLYTQFWISTQFGYPIMRPLWYEFPTDTNTFSISRQFMWGDNMLVAPKIGEPEPVSIAQNGIYNYQVYLPPSSDWYFYDTKQLLDFTSYGSQTIIIGDS